jgi:flagellar hook-associated protein 3 FlgL
MPIVPVQLARVSNLLRTSVATGNLAKTQEQLLRVQNELSTGKRLNSPSDDPGDAAIVQQLQKTLETRKAYVTNLRHAQSHLSEADTTMGELTSLMQQAKQIASANVGSDVTSDQRSAAAVIVNNIFNQALTLANREFDGSYLFGGDRSTEAPFETTPSGVRFKGTGNVLENSFDESTTQPFMVSGDEVFGGFSSHIGSAASLAPTMSAATRLADLAGAREEGVQQGSILISNGSGSRTVDLSKADSIADVIAAINTPALGGITASIAPDGTGIRLTGAAGDNIIVNEVGGGTTAADLGILNTVAGGAGVAVTGLTVKPKVTQFTPLASLNGGAGISASGLIISNGQSTATVAVPTGGTVGDLINAINASGTGVVANVNAAGTGIDIVNPVQGAKMSIAENGGTTAAGLGIRTMSPASLIADLNGGLGVRTIEGPDFTITRNDGTTFDVDVAGTTVQDIINAINTADAGGGVTASFATTGNGIVLTDASVGAGPMTVTPILGSDAAADLGFTQPAVANVIQGTDVNTSGVDGVFATLARLRSGLQANNQSEITAAGTSLEDDLTRVVRVRGQTGARVQELESRQGRLEDQNVATKSLLSSLSDTDFTEAVSRFQALQTALQATLQTTGQMLNLSLMDFIS